MLVYVSVFLAITFASLLARTRNEQNTTLTIIGVFLLLFMGTRKDTGCDYSSYEARFLNNYYSLDYSAYLTQEEPGFHWLNVLVHNLGLDYMWLNILASLIIIICLIRFVRFSPSPLLLLALLFPILIVQLSMSGLRQAIAVAFLTQAMISFLHVERIKIALWILLAAQFHQSAYLFLPLALIAGRQFNWITAGASLAFLGPAAVLLMGERADVYAARYVEQIYGENASGGAVLRYALALLPCILFEANARRAQLTLPNHYPLMRITSIMVFALIPVALLSTVALHRMTYYIYPMAMFIFACMPLVMLNRRAFTRNSMFWPAGVLLVYMVGWFALSRHASYCYLPYESFLY